MSNPPLPLYAEKQHLHSRHLRRPLEFNHNSPLYRCCFMHVQTAALLVAILSSIGLALSTWAYYPIFIEHQIAFALWLLWIPVIICLFIGIFTKNQQLLEPYILYAIIMEITTIMLSIMLVGVMVFKTFVMKEGMEEDSGATMGSKYVGVVIVTIFIFMVSIIQFSCILWFNFVVFLCYQYFCDLKNYRGNLLIRLLFMRF